jgi:hypothetical protein
MYGPGRVEKSSAPHSNITRVGHSVTRRRTDQSQEGESRKATGQLHDSNALSPVPWIAVGWATKCV